MTAPAGQDVADRTAKKLRLEDIATALFVDDRELRRRINPNLGWDRFRAALRECEKRTSPGGLVFPRLSALWGGRYYPGVVAYLDDEAKGRDHGETEAVEDHPETIHAPPRRKTRPQVHQADGAALLARQPGAQEHDGLSGPVIRLAGRRR